MSHTPGKWTTGSVMTQVEVWPKGWNAPLCVADCHTKHAPATEAERVANAQLIASAPELLAALKTMVEVAGTWDDAEGNPGWLIDAKQAIAQAEGRG